MAAKNGRVSRYPNTLNRVSRLSKDILLPKLAIPKSLQDYVEIIHVPKKGMMIVRKQKKTKKPRT